MDTQIHPQAYESHSSIVSKIVNAFAMKSSYVFNALFTHFIEPHDRLLFEEPFHIH